MEIIGRTSIWTYLKAGKLPSEVDNEAIRKDPGRKVRSYMDLATKVAELQFRNRDSVLMFRGQGRDRLNERKETTLKASLFRSKPGTIFHPDADTLIQRFNQLSDAETQLQSKWPSDALGENYVMRYRVLRWAILQHYVVCPTPLLDVTHSLRIAASFASLTKSEKVYLYVLGVPNLSGAVTASAESGLQIIRLSSVCPPNAVRPHIQEGYLLGEYPEMSDFNQKQEYPHHEIDFGRRLVAKFYFNPATFWDEDDFRPVREEVLYPLTTVDPFRTTAEEIKEAISPPSASSSTGQSSAGRSGHAKTNRR